MSLRRRVTKTRAQQFGDELSDGFGHLRSAAVIAAERAAEVVAPRVDTARDALTPRVEAARDVLAPRVGAARDMVGPRVEAARSAATRSWDSTIEAVAPVVIAARRASEEARKHAGKAEKRTRKARKEARSRARYTALAIRGEHEKRRRWPWVMGALALGAAAGAIGVVVSRRSTPEWEEYEPEHEFAVPGATDATASESPAAVAKEKAATAVHAVKEKASGAVDAAKGKLASTGEKAAEKSAVKADQAAVKADQAAETARKAQVDTGKNARPSTNGHGKA